MMARFACALLCLIRSRMSSLAWRNFLLQLTRRLFRGLASIPIQAPSPPFGEHILISANSLSTADGTMGVPMFKCSTIARTCGALWCGNTVQPIITVS
jgi:hypothetical protein